MVGEGIKAALALLAVTGGGWLLIIGADKLARAWGEMLDETLPPSPASAAQAMRGRPCNCRACRNRPTEPCSDFDGD